MASSRQNGEKMRKASRHKKILIAGGAGFIGSNLVREFLAQGHKVDCVDSLITGEATNLDAVRMNRDFRFMHGDIADLGIVSKLQREHYTDIYNLACPTGVPNIASLGEEMMMASSTGTLNLLRVAEQSQARYLFASTAEVYGNPEKFPQSEDYTGNVDPVGLRSPYEEGKGFGEAATAYYARRYGVDTRIVRIFNTYGPFMSKNDQRVIPQMLTRALNQLPLTMYGDGSQTRSFLNVRDLIDGFARVMNQHGEGEVYNIGGETEITIAELAAEILRATGSRSEVVRKSHFITDHDRRLPDTRRIRALGWAPKISLATGLKQSIDHMQMTPGYSLARQNGQNPATTETDHSIAA
jgi:nucleoside-diphosphate-sugar epimerase